MTEPLNAVRDLDLQDFGPTDTLAEVGVWVVAALIASVAWFALISPPERKAPWVGAQRMSARVIAFLRRLGSVDRRGAPRDRDRHRRREVHPRRLSGRGGRRGLGGSWILAGIVIIIVVRLLTERWPTVRIFATAAILLFASYLILAPIAAILIFPDVGQMVLGTVGVILGFGIVARIGTWRWTAWDMRDRRIGHTRDPVIRR